MLPLRLAPWAFIALLSVVGSQIGARRIQNSQVLNQDVHLGTKQETPGPSKVGESPKQPAVDAQAGSPTPGSKPSALLEIGKQSRKSAFFFIENFTEWLSQPLFNYYLLGFGLLLWVCVCFYAHDWFNRPKHLDSEPAKGFRFQQKASIEKPPKIIRHQHIVEGQVVYDWSETTGEATMYVNMPANVSKRDLDIKISSKQIRVGRRGSPCLLEGDFFSHVDKQNSRWALQADGNLEIYLRKKTPAEWPFVLHFRKKSLESSCRLPEIIEEEQQTEG